MTLSIEILATFAHTIVKIALMTITEQKKSLRQEMLLQRRIIEDPEKALYDQWICDELMKRIVDHSFKIVHAYIPFNTEIDIRPLLSELLHKNITVVCPQTLPKRALEHRILSSLDNLETGIMGTKHPMERNIYTGPFDFIIVPGLAFDHTNRRLGYGGGYYDNFLMNHPEALKTGIFYPFQKADKVPYEEHDVCLDEILVRH